MIKLNGLEVKFESFPNGEIKVDHKKLVFSKMTTSNIYFKYEDDSDLIKLMFIKKYLERYQVKNVKLTVAYMPYSRMDRVENHSIFSLKYIADFINSMNFSSVNIIEPHSDVTPALINNSLTKNVTFDMLPIVEEETLFDKDIDFLFFPDAGAQKRYQNLKGYRQIVGYKNRNFSTGEIESLDVVGKLPESRSHRKIIIMDDLCSYGGTFLHSAKKLKELNFGEIYLLVAHCEHSIFSGELINSGLVSKIFTTNSIIDSTKDSFGSCHDDIMKIYKLEELL